MTRDPFDRNWRTPEVEAAIARAIAGVKRRDTKPARTSMDKTNITILLDRSGSMYSIRTDVVGGINAYVAALDPGQCWITVIQFDDQDPHEIVRLGVPLDQWEPMADTDFEPRGNTPLIDAMGLAITGIDHRDDTRQIFVVMTDGMENASSEWTNDRLAALVNERTEQGWVFTYLGANQDAFVQAKQLGIAAGNVQNFHADTRGVQVAYASAGGMTNAVRASANVDSRDVYASTNTPRTAEEDHQSR